MIKIKNQIDGLTQEEWWFREIDNNLFLDSYFFSKRETKRHKYQTKKRYDRIMTRNSTLEESEVPFPEEVKKEALEKFISNIQVLKWSER